MIRSRKFALALCAATAAGMAVPAAASDSLECADWVSTSIDDEPGVWHLTGTETRTVTHTYTIQATPGSIGSTTTVTKTVTYQVGTYSSDTGSVKLDCRDYLPEPE